MVLSSPFRPVGLGDIKLQKWVFESKIRSVVEYGAGVWGFDKGVILEILQLKYYRRMLSLNERFNSLVIKNDLGILSLRIES